MINRIKDKTKKIFFKLYLQLNYYKFLSFNYYTVKIIKIKLLYITFINIYNMLNVTLQRYELQRTLLIINNNILTSHICSKF